MQEILFDVPNYHKCFKLHSVRDFGEDHYDCLIITHKPFGCDEIMDYTIENATILHENNKIIIKSSKETKTGGIFGMVSWLNDGAKTLMEVVNCYDGSLYYHNNNYLLYVERGISQTDDVYINSEICFITAYNEATRVAKRMCNEDTPIMACMP